MSTERDRNEPLTPKQEGVAVSMASGRSIEDSATDNQCGAATIKKWLREQPAFKQRIRELRAEMTERALGILLEGMAEAATTLRQLLKSKSEAMQHKAAESLLTHGAQMSALSELQERVARLEGEK